MGEEWIYFHRYTARTSKCVAKDDVCVLQITVDDFEQIREKLMNQGRGKDVSMLES